MELRKIKIAILSISALLMTATLITGILAEISKHYSDAGMSVVSMVLTLPFLVATAFSLFAGPLSARISKKTLVIFSLCCLLAGGFSAFFFGKADIKVLLGASILMGITQGMLSTLSMALVADYFEGHECGALMGLCSAFVNFGGMIITFAAAMLSGIQWHYAYLVVGVAVISLFIVINYLPKDDPAQRATSTSDEKGGLTGVVFLNVLTVFFYAMSMFAFQSNIAMFLDMNQLGDATTAGLVSTALVTAGGITGIAYGRLSKMLNGLVLPMGMTVTAVGFIQLFLLGNIVSVFIAAACAGFGLTSVMPTALFSASAAVKPSLSATAIAMVNCAANVGIFLSPLVIPFLAKNVSSGDIRTNFMTGALGLILVSIFYLVGNARFAKSTQAAVAQ